MKYELINYDSNFFYKVLSFIIFAYSSENSENLTIEIAQGNLMFEPIEKLILVW